MDKEQFTTFQIEKKLGLKRNRLKEWVPKYIKPSYQAAIKQGVRNLFSLWDVYMLMVFAHLRDIGFSCDDASSRIRLIKLESRTSNPENLNILGFPRRTKGKYIDPNVKEKPCVKVAYGLAYPDVICGKNMNEFISDLGKFDLLKNEIDDVFILNFDLIRSRVNKALM